MISSTTQYIFFAISIVSISITGFADSFEAENNQAREELRQECHNNKVYLNNSYPIDCNTNYHHYNSSAARQNYNKRNAIKMKKIRISEFNLLHPGMGKSRFKDYKKVALIINQFDLVGAVELIPLVGSDYKNNKNVVNFILTTPKLLIKIADEIKTLEVYLSTGSRARRNPKKKKRLLILQRQKHQLIADLKDAKSLYRSPGYLKILNELHKLTKDKSWALILSPRGEAPITSPTSELVGYYYRSTIVKPKSNSYCRSTRRSSIKGAFACIVNMDKVDMGEDKRDAFARRPFFAEFKSGNFSFALLTSHVLFSSPKTPSAMKNILQKSFGVDHYTDLRALGTGASGEKYARFAEIKMIMDFVQRQLNKRKRGTQKDIIYMGDFNLESSNKFWPAVLNSWRGAQLYVKGKTSLTKARFNSDGSETFAGASNYDHFIFDPQETDECINPQTNTIAGGVAEFSKGKMARSINRTYRVRKGRASRFKIFPYVKNGKKYNDLMRRIVTPKLDGSRPIYTIGTKYVTLGTLRLKSKGIIANNKETIDFADFFKTRILDSQFSNELYYYYLQQIISDHFPIHMSCSTI